MPGGDRVNHFNLGETMKALPVLAVAAILAMTGCGASQSASSASTPAAASATPTPTHTLLPGGKFTLKTKSGATVNFTLPAPPTDPAVAPIEAYRVKTGAAAATYIVADVDNRNGSELVNMYKVLAFDTEGNQYTFTPASNAVHSWEPVYGSDYKYKMPNGTVLDDATGDALSGQGVSLENANMGDTEVGARKTVVLASDSASLPSQFTKVVVMPSGGDTEEDASQAQ